MCLMISNKVLPQLGMSVSCRTTNLEKYLYSKQLLNIGNGKIQGDISTGCITFPADFCQFIESKTELIIKVFPNIVQNYTNHDWLSERARLRKIFISTNYISRFKVKLLENWFTSTIIRRLSNVIKVFLCFLESLALFNCDFGTMWIKLSHISNISTVYLQNSSRL